MDLGIRDRKALITGGAGGLGLETARLLLQEGVRVVLTDLDRDALEAARAELDCAATAGDLSSTDGARALIAETGKDFDILVHATGITGAKGDPIATEDADWEEAWHIDFMSAVRLTRLLAPGMIERGWGRMIFVASRERGAALSRGSGLQHGEKRSGQLR